MKLTALLIAASLTGAAPPPEPPPQAQTDMFEIASGATVEVTCGSPRGCLLVTVEFMQGYTAFIEREARKKCRRTEL